MRCLPFAVISLLVISSIGPAQEEKKPLPPFLQKLFKATPEEFIKRFDKDKDGAVGRDELPPFLAKAFDRADRDGSGKLDRPEVAAMLQVMATMAGGLRPNPEQFVDGILKQFDSDKDGKLSKDEAKGRLADGFKKIDANRDGQLDRKELRAVAERALAGPLDGGRPAALDFDSLDKNADGRLTRDELRGTPFVEQFAEIDADRSGQVDRQEFEGYQKKDAKKAEKE